MYSVARCPQQAGHSVATLASHYAGLLRELEDQPRTPAAEAVRSAREAASCSPRDCCPGVHGRGSSSPVPRRSDTMPRPVAYGCGRSAALGAGPRDALDRGPEHSLDVIAAGHGTIDEHRAEIVAEAQALLDRGGVR